jgi:hypothetical protein
MINSFGDFERQFGGLGVNYPLSYAVRDFYFNGGSQAIIVRLYKDPATPGDAKASLAVDDLSLTAKSPGAWGKKLRATIDVDVPDEMRTRLGLSATDALFNFTIRLGNNVEQFLNLTVTDNARRLDRVLKAESSLVEWKGNWPGTTPTMAKVATARAKLKDLNDALNATPVVPATVTAREPLTRPPSKIWTTPRPRPKSNWPLHWRLNLSTSHHCCRQTALQTAEDNMKGSNGGDLDQAAYEGSKDNKTGLYALDKADLLTFLRSAR